MSEDRIRRRAVIHGVVQGVSFRAATRREARRAGVAGWVRNRSDGSVEAAFEGTTAAVESMLAFCERGPTWAEVSRVDVVAEPLEDEAGFRILR